MYIFLFFIKEKESNVDILSGEDYGDMTNISRRRIYSKFDDRSFLNTTSTPIKSPYNLVSLII